MSPLHNNKRFHLNNVRAINNLSLPTQTVNLNDLSAKIRNLPLRFAEIMEPKILIGVQHHKLITPLEVVEGESHEPTAINTPLGWTLLGGDADERCPNISLNFHTKDDPLDNLVRNYFDIESWGVRCSAKLESDDDLRAKAILSKTVQKVDTNRFEAGLLWKNDNIMLPDSLAMASNRFMNLEKKLKRNPELHVEMNKQMKEYIQNGYARVLNHIEQKVNSPRTWYLPIFPVINANKGKVRVVWDAAAIANGTSLNANLLKGPEFMNNLMDIIFKFREGKYAITGDIRHMFHQVRIVEEDQDSQRFLWRFNEKEEIKTLTLQVLSFGATCSPYVANYIKNYNAEQHRDRFPRAFEAIVNRHFVDDWLDSFNSKEECTKTLHQVFQVHAAAGFQIRNFYTNHREVLIGTEDYTNEQSKPLGQVEEKVLGMWWNTQTDSFVFRVNTSRMESSIINGSKRPTKRQVLSTIMMTFDPNGLISLYTIYGKLLVQDLWRSGISWNDPIKDPEYENGCST